MKNVRNLKGVKNKLGQFYYINKQLPEALVEKSRDIRQTIKDIKKKEEDVLPQKQNKDRGESWGYIS